MLNYYLQNKFNHLNCYLIILKNHTCSAVSTTGASEGGGAWFNPGMPPPNRKSLSMFITEINTVSVNIGYFYFIL